MDTRLVRPTNDRMIAGVCAGLGRYFNIDPTIVRLVFVLAVFAGGVSPLIYVLLWIVMPESGASAFYPTQNQNLNYQALPQQDPTGEWQFDPYTGDPIKRPEQKP